MLQLFRGSLDKLSLQHPCWGRWCYHSSSWCWDSHRGCWSSAWLGRRRLYTCTLNRCNYALNLSYPQNLKAFFEVLHKWFFQLDASKLSTKVQMLKNKLYEWAIDLDAVFCGIGRILSKASSKLLTTKHYFANFSTLYSANNFTVLFFSPIAPKWYWCVGE